MKGFKFCINYSAMVYLIQILKRKKIINNNKALNYFYALIYNMPISGQNMA